MKPCKKCGNIPELFCSNSTGYVILCKCGEKAQGYKRREYAIDAWNMDQEIIVN